MNRHALQRIPNINAPCKGNLRMYGMGYHKMIENRLKNKFANVICKYSALPENKAVNIDVSDRPRFDPRLQGNICSSSIIPVPTIGVSAHSKTEELEKSIVTPQPSNIKV